jgi:oligopeptide transport system permease protein
LIALVGGVLLGVISALYPQKFIGRAVSTISGVFMSIPSFVFAGILIAIFGLWLNLLPVALWEGPEYIILPALTLAIAPLAYITRITRSTVIDVLNKEFVKTALAKGQSELKIIIKHVLPNSLIPILTVAGPLVAILITGSFVVEYIFALPGMGKYFVTAFINRDYFLVSGTVVIFSIILLTVNTLVDLLIVAISPKAD